MATLLRLAEDLERSRDQVVRAAHVAVDDGTVRLDLASEGDVRVAALGGGARGGALRARLRPRAGGLTALSASSPATVRWASIPIPRSRPPPRPSARRAAGPTGTSSGSTGALIASASSISSPAARAVADEAERAGADLAVALEHEPGDQSPSSHSIRSISNGFMRTVCGGNGQLALWSALALVIASKFLASALMVRR